MYSEGVCCLILFRRASRPSVAQPRMTNNLSAFSTKIIRMCINEFESSTCLCCKKGCFCFQKKV